MCKRGTGRRTAPQNSKPHQLTAITEYRVVGRHNTPLSAMVLCRVLTRHLLNARARDS